MPRLPRDFYNRDTVTVAHELLGKILVHQIDGLARMARIVEVEAYLGPGDLAAHSARGLTPRTRAMFGPPGHAYVYLIYGMHHCLNVVTEPEGSGTGVLLRAVEPIANIEGNTRGPGLLTRAMGIDKRHYGHDLCSDELHLLAPLHETQEIEIVASPRIGVPYAQEWADKPLRFHILGNRYVSRK
ncbi:DNA-3-methyladenine glycosylase [Pusillimonas sp. CC-YST705]|uniref:Putative 3-methyladenine DNA glycosylase n=1 Tax=Mesopusillimonas faecipullorum TaxID=2755040 RepID=A0ABS8CA16_9BURK|nr:DNA-3-methyladenine glycosylase [Mesopusillimonas faecipullorum]MCB5362872.1 DNA-3-methyladenine glycosylase [Mesopusillimonas faecipullorum]